MNFQTEKKLQEYFGIQRVEQIKKYTRTRIDYRSFMMNSADLISETIPVEYEYDYKITVNEDFINLLELIIRREESDQRFYNQGFSPFESRKPVNLIEIYHRLKREFEDQDEDRRMQQKHPELAEIMKDYRSMKALLTSSR
jgi:hypothetical protein